MSNPDPTTPNSQSTTNSQTSSNLISSYPSPQSSISSNMLQNNKSVIVTNPILLNNNQIQSNIQNNMSQLQNNINMHSVQSNMNNNMQPLPMPINNPSVMNNNMHPLPTSNINSLPTFNSNMHLAPTNNINSLPTSNIHPLPTNNIHPLPINNMQSSLNSNIHLKQVQASHNPPPPSISRQQVELEDFQRRQEMQYRVDSFNRTLQDFNNNNMHQNQIQNNQVQVQLKQIQENQIQNNLLPNMQNQIQNKAINSQNMQASSNPSFSSSTNDPQEIAMKKVAQQSLYDIIFDLEKILNAHNGYAPNEAVLPHAKFFLNAWEFIYGPINSVTAVQNFCRSHPIAPYLFNLLQSQIAKENENKRLSEMQSNLENKAPVSNISPEEERMIIEIHTLAIQRFGLKITNLEFAKALLDYYKQGGINFIAEIFAEMIRGTILPNGIIKLDPKPAFSKANKVKTPKEKVDKIPKEKKPRAPKTPKAPKPIDPNAPPKGSNMHPKPKKSTLTDPNAPLVELTSKSETDPILPVSKSKPKKKKSLTVKTESKNSSDELFPWFPIDPFVLRSIRKMMSQFKELDVEGYFYYPVDPKQFPHYYTVILEPMSLSTINTRITRGRYTSYSQIYADLKLIIQNCQYYNDSESLISKAATAYWEKIEPIIKEVGEILLKDFIKSGGVSNRKIPKESTQKVVRKESRNSAPPPPSISGEIENKDEDRPGWDKIHVNTFEAIDRYIPVIDPEIIAKKLQSSGLGDCDGKYCHSISNLGPFDSSISENGGFISKCEDRSKCIECSEFCKCDPAVCQNRPITNNKRKVLGIDVVQRMTYGIDSFTRHVMLKSMPPDVTEEQGEHFLQTKLMPQINQHNPNNLTRFPVADALMVLRSIESRALILNDTLSQDIAHHLIDQMLKSYSSKELAGNNKLLLDEWPIYPKGMGVVCMAPEGIKSNELIAEYYGEVYPPWRWQEKEDVLKENAKKLEKADEFYNIMLERRRDDEAGYDLLFVDPIRKGNFASRMSHSCDPNCSTVVMSANGKYFIGMYALKDIGFSEELTFDYNSVTESLEEYKSSICLCATKICRGSFLALIGTDTFEQVINRDHTFLNRTSMLLRACCSELTDQDRLNLNDASIRSSILDGLPDWCIKYAALIIDFMNQERERLPLVLVEEAIKLNKDEPNFSLETAEIEARGVYLNRLQNIAISLDRVKYVLRQPNQNQAPPLIRLDNKRVIEMIWNNSDSLISKFHSSIRPHLNNIEFEKFDSLLKVPLESDNVAELKQRLLTLRDMCRALTPTWGAYHHAAADLFHLYAHTENWFAPSDYLSFKSPPFHYSELGLQSIPKAVLNQHVVKETNRIKPKVIKVLIDSDYEEELAAEKEKRDTDIIMGKRERKRQRKGKSPLDSNNVTEIADGSELATEIISFSESQVELNTNLLIKESNTETLTTISTTETPIDILNNGNSLPGELNNIEVLDSTTVLPEDSPTIDALDTSKYLPDESPRTDVLDLPEESLTIEVLDRDEMDVETVGGGIVSDILPSNIDSLESSEKNSESILQNPEKNAPKVRSAEFIESRTYPSQYVWAALTYWFKQTLLLPVAELGNDRKGCVSLPTFDSLYGKVKGNILSRTYSSQFRNDFLTTIQSNPSTPWNTGPFLFQGRNSYKILGSPMMDYAYNNDKLKYDNILLEMKNWSVKFPSVSHSRK